ncbi:hypothetical protein [Spirosoma pulveris]
MQRNQYYRQVYKRTNAFKVAIYMMFLNSSSWPRLTIELFTRRKFGTRYFTFSGTIVFAVLLACYPVLNQISASFLFRHRSYGPDLNFGELLKHYLTWYAYLAAMVYRAYHHWSQIKREPGDFDFNWFSLSPGLVDARFFNVEWGGKPVNVRMVETLIEPGLFFFIGFMLWLIGQSLGPLLMICAVIYGMSYRAQYYIGDNFMYDKSDELIANRQLHNTYVNGMDASQTQGFQVYGRRPADPDFRRDLADMMIDRDELIEAV